MSSLVKKTSLAQMQRNFISDCLSGKLSQENTLMAKDIDSRVISAQGLMGIYQNSAMANISHSLSLTYPVIEKLVGEVFFQASCKEFIRITWPKSGNMDDYGVEFADFLAQFEHAQQLVYLADVARLEWLFHQSSLADDAKITDWSTLAQVSDILQLRFILSPSVKLITSVFPIDKIWQFNQSDSPPDIDFDMSKDNEGAYNESQQLSLVVFRQVLKTVILSITHGEFALLQALSEKQSFEQAIIKATKKQADISVDTCLKKFIELGIISGFVAPSC